ncbi:hypothetical protein Bhyg_11959 [Pseudolycoriella hygida]|uniref:Uncharacterized protein n=1 Tax=Pseudolycoriella hygida TaxID=35572 RepID=A0A9Q0MWD5_9DIPT|nr:hypothetical protein Bhyg_11959 [Pseudolycoriella hygida]
MIQILLMLFLITIKCNKVVGIERTSKINNVKSEVTSVFPTDCGKLNCSLKLHDDKNDVRKNHHTNSGINGNTTRRNAVPPAFLLPANGSASNGSVSQVHVFLLSEPNTAQVTAGLNMEFSNEFQPNSIHRNIRNRRDNNRRNICGNECKCRQENKFDTVDCEFAKETAVYELYSGSTTNETTNNHRILNSAATDMI